MLTPWLHDLILLVLLAASLWLLMASLWGGRQRELLWRLDTRLEELNRRLNHSEERQHEAMTQLKETVAQRLADGHLHTSKTLHDGLQDGLTLLQTQVTEALLCYSQELSQRVDALTQATDKRLLDISGQVEKRLSEGFEKTTATFADVVKRLAIIDEAQKRITELSSNVVSLQEVLSDKRARGAFGEIQLAALVRNLLPETHFALQYKLPNDKIVDCALFMPAPTGLVPIDAKFPLESYRLYIQATLPEAERKAAERQFKVDVRKHIQDIAGKYIIPGTTADGAVMFIPAEAVFAEIQSRHLDLVEEANNARVWMVSPTTLWAVLNTARAVLKDAATREQVHIIQEHLSLLAVDFDRFRERMDQLARHIEQAHDDVQKVNTSARKISDRFARIEQVELEHPEVSPQLPVPAPD
jgi:DNA recombination protein RmuC